jgi:predicted nucleotidyltransferase
MFHLASTHRSELFDNMHDEVIGIAQSIVAAFTQQFPRRVRACYLLGSAADGSELRTSDLDLTLIFAGVFATPEERDAAMRLITSLSSHAPVELDIEIADEQTLASGLDPNLKFAATLLYGEDIRADLPLIPIADWTRDRMHSSWWRVARLFERPRIITPPLAYPEPAREFLGYTRRGVLLEDGRIVPSTRDLIRLVGWAATALLALDCGVYVARKRDAHRLYHEHIGGPWDTLILDVYETLRTRWAYLIPDDQQDRAILRAICERTLEFERYFLARYRPYVLAELRAEGDRALAACEVLRRAPLAEPEALYTLQALLRVPEARVQAAASAALGALCPDV